LPSDALSAVRRLQAIASALRLGDAELGNWFEAAIDAAIAGEPLERALGLHGSWRKSAAVRCRDEVLREIAARPPFAGRHAAEIARLILRRPDLLAQLPANVKRSDRTIRRALQSGQSNPLLLASDSEEDAPHVTRCRASGHHR
jgi:hypothetical protein